MGYVRGSVPFASSWGYRARGKRLSSYPLILTTTTNPIRNESTIWIDWWLERRTTENISTRYTTGEVKDDTELTQMNLELLGEINIMDTEFMQRDLRQILRDFE